MDFPRLHALVVIALLAVLAESFPQQQAPGSGKAAFGSTYDEIVVETQLAVRPKSPGEGQRTGRAKAVFFRPSSSGADSRRVRPTESAPVTTTTTTSTSSSTPSDGISFAARVVGVENSLAAKNRKTRESSGSTSSSFQSSSFRSSSSSGGGSSGSKGFTSSGSSTATRPHQLPNGKTVSVTTSEEFKVGPGEPSSSLLTLITGSH